VWPISDRGLLKLEIPGKLEMNRRLTAVKDLRTSKSRGVAPEEFIEGGDLLLWLCRHNKVDGYPFLILLIPRLGNSEAKREGISNRPMATNEPLQTVSFMISEDKRYGGLGSLGL
jgi:hypothetical protein